MFFQLRDLFFTRRLSAVLIGLLLAISGNTNYTAEGPDHFSVNLIIESERWRDHFRAGNVDNDTNTDGYSNEDSEGDRESIDDERLEAWYNDPDDPDRQALLTDDSFRKKSGHIWQRSTNT